MKNFIQGFQHSFRSLLRVGGTSILLASLVGSAACSEQIDPVPNMVQLEGAQPLNVSPDQAGASIVAHPSFSLLSQRGTELIAAVTYRLSSMPDEQIPGLLQSLQSCQTNESCEALLQQEFGITPAQLHEAATAAEQITLDVGLQGTADQARLAAFQHAQVEADGEYHENDVLAAVLPNPGFFCNAYQGCEDELGIVLGAAKSDWMNTLSLGADSAPLGSSTQTEDGGDSNGAGTIIAVVGIVIKVTEWLVGVIWDPDEEDKECHHDGNCEPTEYCHKIGSNDCRPRRNQGALCTRHTQCSTGCCRFNWGAFVCRPSNRCN